MGFESLVFWHWLAAGAVLMILELIAPGVIFMWLGLACVITGIVFWTLPELTLESQLAIFAALSVIGAITGRAIGRSRDRPRDYPSFGQPDSEHIGAVYLLEEPTVNGHGEVRIGDSVWPIELRPHEGELSEGDLVKVSAVDGATLIVEPAADRALWGRAQE